MASQIITTAVTGKQDVAGGEAILITAAGSVFAATGNAITTSGGNLATLAGSTVNVQGAVMAAAGTAVQLGTLAGDNNHRLFVGDDGYITGGSNHYAVDVRGFQSTIENDGTIWNRNSVGSGIIVESVGVTNNGIDSVTHITNTKSINAANIGIAFDGNEHLVIANSGTIRGDSAISFIGTLGGKAIEVVNTGTIIGNVFLGNGNDTFNTIAGQAAGSVYGGAGDDVLLGSKGNDVFFGDALLGGLDGNDKIYGYDGNDKLSGGAGLDNLKGGNGNDVLSGGDGVDMVYGEAGNDIIDGGLGKDSIYGGLGVDTLTGGADADQFFFKAGETGATKTTADTIHDLTTGDIIDLTSIDASTKTTGNQNFTFIGTHAFNGNAGELRYEKLANDTYIYGDMNGDKKVDLAIHLDGAHVVAAADFHL